MKQEELIARIRTALHNNDYSYRTVDGIARETGIDVKKVRFVLDNARNLARRTPMTDSFGRTLYAPASRKVTLLTRFREALAAHGHVDAEATPRSHKMVWQGIESRLQDETRPYVTARQLAAELRVSQNLVCRMLNANSKKIRTLPFVTADGDELLIHAARTPALKPGGQTRRADDPAIRQQDEAQQALVEKALNNPNFTCRTVRGLARETGLEEYFVHKALAARPDMVRETVFRNEEGYALLAPSSRKATWREHLATVRAHIGHQYTVRSPGPKR